MDDAEDEPWVATQSSGGCFGGLFGCSRPEHNAGGLEGGNGGVADWLYVGDGRGSYRKVPHYTYVGYGAGSYDVQETPFYYGCRLRRSGLLCLAFVAVVGVCGWLVLRQAGGQVATTTVRQSSGSEDCMADLSAEAVAAVWHRVDINKDSFVSHDELWTAEKFDRITTNQFVAMRSADVDGDNKLSTAEFGAAMAEAASLDAESWSMEKRYWCCERAGIGCTRTSTTLMSSTTVSMVPYRCEVDAVTGLPGWPSDARSYDKRDWCCRHEGKLCETTTMPPYDCLAGTGNWELGWSLHKKAWCCDKFGVACRDASTAATYDCDRDYVNWAGAPWGRLRRLQVEGWSHAKQIWCCQHANRGCSREHAAIATSAPFDCEAGRQQWRSGWSDDKKVWCCREEGVGCDAAKPVVYDCDLEFARGSEDAEAFMALWSAEKRDWCCTYADRGCVSTTTLRHQCSPGVGNWPEEWSADKRRWCCDHAGHGCEDDSEASVDCEAGLDRLGSWSNAKRAFCCRSSGRGCDECDRGDPQRWPMAQRERCCEGRGIGCEQHTEGTEDTEDTEGSRYACRGFACPGGFVARADEYCEGSNCTTSACCSRRAKCSSFTCPAGHVPHSESGSRLCAAASCSADDDLSTCCAPRALCAAWVCTGGLVPREQSGSTLCAGATCDPHTDAATCCRQAEGARAVCSTMACPRGYYPRAGRATYLCAGAKCNTTVDLDRCCDEAFVCEVDCRARGAEAVELPGAVGRGADAHLVGMTVEACREACIDSSRCQGIVFGDGRCYGRREVHTGKCDSDAGHFTTEVLRGQPWGTCTVVGAGHVFGFDRPRGPSLEGLAPGEYRLVESLELSVHGRFGPTAVMPNISSLTGLALGGALLDHHHLALAYVGPKLGHAGFRLAWDGEEFFADKDKDDDAFASDDGFLTATLSTLSPSGWAPEARAVISEFSEPALLYRFDLKPGIRLHVLLRNDSCNALLEMQHLITSQDGLCGTFDCNPRDDELPAIARRGLASPIGSKQSLFRFAVKAARQEPVAGHHVGNTTTSCNEALEAEAKHRCRTLGAAERRVCVADACVANRADVAEGNLAVAAWRKQLECVE